MWLYICLLWSGLCVAQSPYFRVHELPESTSDKVCRSVYQDRSGYVWLSAEGGAFRFNGLDFRWVPAGKAALTALYEAKSGVFWAGDAEGNLYQLDRLRLLWKPIEPEEGHPAVKITGFGEDFVGNLWFGAYGEGVYYIKGRHVYHVGTDDGLADLSVYNLRADSSGLIWVATDGGLSALWLQGNQKMVRNFGVADGLPDVVVRCLAIGHDGRVYAGLYEGGVCRVQYRRGAAHAVIDYLTPQWQFGAVSSIAVSPLAEKNNLPPHEIWIGTERNGLYSWNGGRIQAQSESPQARIYGLAVDMEGNLWMCSSDLNIASANLHFLFVAHELGPIQAVCETPEGSLWAGTTSGLWRKRGANFEKNSAFSGKNITSLHFQPPNTLWVGTFGHGLFKFGTSERSAAVQSLKGLTNDNILSLSADGNQLNVTTLGGITVLDVTTNKVTQQFNKASGLPTDFIYQATTALGELWLGSDGYGLVTEDNGVLSNISKVADTELQTVFSLSGDERQLWFNTAQQGLFRYDGRRFKKYGHEDGLRVASITSLLLIQNQLMLVHPKGIDIMDTHDGHIRYYGRSFGIQLNDPQLNAISKTNNPNQETIWTGGEKQLIAYRPFIRDQRDPVVMIKQVSHGHDAIDFTRVDQFSYDENYLIFDFDGLWFSEPEAIRFRYKLDGYDLDWVETKDRRVVYPRLPAGHYTFRVEATEHADFGGVKEVTYGFTIKSPFWQTWWFWAMVLAVAFLLIRNYQRMREERLRKEQQIQKEMAESKLQTLRAQINPHFLFNSFNTLIAMIEDDPTSAVRFTEQLSDFYRSLLLYRETDLISITEELTLVRQFYSLLQHRYGDNIHLDIGDIAGDTKVAPLTLQMLVENAVKHNIISSSKPLSISIREEGNSIVVQNKLQPKRDKEPSTGLGLDTIRRRYLMLAGKHVEVSNTDHMFTVVLPKIN